MSGSVAEQQHLCTFKKKKRQTRRTNKQQGLCQVSDVTRLWELSSAERDAPGSSCLEGVWLQREIGVFLPSPPWLSCSFGWLWCAEGALAGGRRGEVTLSCGGAAFVGGCGGEPGPAASAVTQWLGAVPSAGELQEGSARWDGPGWSVGQGELWRSEVLSSAVVLQVSAPRFPLCDTEHL